MMILYIYRSSPLLDFLVVISVGFAWVCCFRVLMVATFDTSRERPPQQPTTDKPRSAWDALRARAQNPQQPQQEQPPKEKNIWGEDK